LEKEGVLAPQGAGRRRKIVMTEGIAPPRLRVGIMLYEKEDRKEEYVVELVYQLQEKGHIAVPSARSLIDLGMDLQRVERFVAKSPADAWVVIAGSHEVLEWFSRQQTPAFALFGRFPSLHIAGTGPRKSTAMVAAVRRLIELGHRRIVLLAREERRKPGPGFFERVFLEELERQGIVTGPYNLPDWEDNPEGLQRCLFSLFQKTPPTALIIQGSILFAATQQFLIHQGIRVPQEVSIVCTVPDPAFGWSRPTIAHINIDSRIWIQNILRWVNKVARGKEDRRQIATPAEFVEGGTIGPVKG
jgi:DNA-binding LacI/PurR family transcriptional regulator